MQDEHGSLDVSLTGMEFPEWKQSLEELVEEVGTFQPLGDQHFSTFVDAGKTLLVTFEMAEAVRTQAKDARPLGFELVLSKGWSHLGLLAEDHTWFREERLYGYFDRLIDDGFFEDFDRVVFYGAGACAYAAAAYSVAAPGATVIAVQPQATLDARMTEWDPRFPEAKRLNFTDRYGYAPDMLDASDRSYVIYDPREDLDAMHATLFARPNVSRLRVTHLGDEIESTLASMGILMPMIEKAGDGTLSDLEFFRLYRIRRSHGTYLRALLNRLDTEDRPYLSVLVCRNVVARMRAPRLRRRLNTLMKAAEEGKFRPPPKVAGDTEPPEAPELD